MDPGDSGSNGRPTKKYKNSGTTRREREKNKVFQGVFFKKAEMLCLYTFSYLIKK